MSGRLFAKKSIHDMAGLLTFILGLTALVGYLIFAGKTGSCNYMLVILPLGVMLFSRALVLWIESDILILIGNVGISIAFCAFLTDSIQIIIGYFTRVAIFGDVTQFGSVIVLSVILLLGCITSIVYSFIN